MKTITEYVTILDNKVNVVDRVEAFAIRDKNVYFLDGVRSDLDYSKWQRAKDEDVILKDMFVLDIDLRNNCDYEIENDDIIQIAKDLAEHLEKDDEYFWEWSKIVFTGNWLHLYFSWEWKSFTKEEYSLWVERIYRQWDKCIWEPYQCDHACKNLARILRLPWSINQKNWATVEIIANRDKKSRLFNLIKSFAKKELQEIKIRDEKKRKELEKQLQNFKWDDNKIYEQINSIPAYLIAQMLIPEFPFDWKKNFKNKKWWYTWYFYCKDTNTIINWGSRYFLFDWTVSSWWNNFCLIKYFKWFDNRQTFQFFTKLLK